MLYDVGGVAFEVAGLNTDKVGRSSETAFAEHQVIGTAPVYEHTGEDKRAITISGKVHPLAFGGEGGLAALNAIRQTGEPVFVMRGDGTPLGWCVIDKISERGGHLYYDGQPQEIEHELLLLRCDAPSVITIIGSFLALF